MIDLSGRDEIAHLVDPLHTIDRHAVALELPYLVVGAAARDLHLNAVRGIAIRRMTTDIDIAVAVQDWSAYDTLRTAFPQARRGTSHEVTVGNTAVDLVPFGGVERADRTIAWPPAGDTVMSAFGLAEALTTAEQVRLAPSLTVRVASLPAQTVLKFAAWEERHLVRPRHDSVDLQMILKSFGDSWNFDRLYTGPGVAVLEFTDYDVELAGAMLLGTDVRDILNPHALAHFRDLVSTTMRETGGLADDMPGNRSANEHLIRAFYDGLA